MYNLQLKRLRKEAGLTQKQLGDELGVSLRVVSSWEIGDTSLSFSDAFRISIVLGCSLEELAGDSSNENGANKNDEAQSDVTVMNLEELDGEELNQVQQFVDFVISKRG